MIVTYLMIAVLYCFPSDCRPHYLFLQLPVNTDKQRFLSFKDVLDMGAANTVPFGKYKCVVHMHSQ